MKTFIPCLCIVLVGLSQPLAAQEAEGAFSEEETFSPANQSYLQEPIARKELDRDAWREVTEGMDFSKSRKRNLEADDDEAEGEKKKKKKRSILANFLNPQNAEAGISVLKILLILVAAVALFFLIRSLLGLRGPSNRKVTTADLIGLGLEHIEEHFQELDLDDFIRQAIARGDYMLAVRLYYLAVLKVLTAHDWIRWAKDKTNRDYLREMRGRPLLPAFQEVTYLFEWVWYGQRAIGQAAFQAIEVKMRAFLEAVPEQSKAMEAVEPEASGLSQ